MERLRALQKARAKTGVQDLTAEQISSIQTRVEEMKARGEALRELPFPGWSSRTRSAGSVPGSPAPDTVE
ncbi:hypothetical protein GT043_30825 [Streptomyces sp. SID2131]|nr:hypothetical protein [Streptomyces sp. SID2131]